MDKMEIYQNRLFNNQTRSELFFYKRCIEFFKEQQERFHFPLIHRQVKCGWYIADFVFIHKHLIIELDGDYHFSLDNRTDDILRDGYFKNLGFDILRYPNKEIFEHIDEILEYIDLWASGENSISNYLFYRKKIKIQNRLQQEKRLKRRAKSKELRN